MFTFPRFSFTLIANFLIIYWLGPWIFLRFVFLANYSVSPEKAVLTLWHWREMMVTTPKGRNSETVLSRMRWGNILNCHFSLATINIRGSWLCHLHTLHFLHLHTHLMGSPFLGYVMESETQRGLLRMLSSFSTYLRKSWGPKKVICKALVQCLAKLNTK